MNMNLFDDIVIDLEDMEETIEAVEKNVKKAIVMLGRAKYDKDKVMDLLAECIELLNPPDEDMEIEMEDEK
jgi:hypothetical protein